MGVEFTLPEPPPPQAARKNITGAIAEKPSARRPADPDQSDRPIPEFFIIHPMPLPGWCRVVEHMRAQASMPPVFPTRVILFQEPPDEGRIRAQHTCAPLRLFRPEQLFLHAMAYAVWRAIEKSGYRRGFLPRVRVDPDVTIPMANITASMSRSSVNLVLRSAFATNVSLPCRYAG